MYFIIYLTFRLRHTLIPFFLASTIFFSFTFTRLIKSSRHFDGFTCSIRIFILKFKKTKQIFSINKLVESI